MSKISIQQSLAETFKQSEITYHLFNVLKYSMALVSLSRVDVKV